MATTTTTDVDARLVAVVTNIHAKIPPEKKLTVGVLLQLLTSRFQAQFPGVVFEDKKVLLEATLAKLQAPPPPLSVSKSVKVVQLTGTATADEDDDDSDDDDDESFDEEDDEEDSDDEEEESDESDFSGDDSSSSSSSDNKNDSAEEPATKKARVEAPTSATEATDISSLTPEARVEGMMYCLNKLGYRPRKRGDDESAQAFLDGYLIGFFVSKQLDPTKFSADDIKRYKIKKEVADLLADGGSLTLEKGSRRGRAFVAPPPPPPQSTTVTRPSFLDDEE